MLDNVLQLTVNGLINGTSYALLGVAFSLILGVTGRFHVAFTFTYTISAYLAAVAGERAGLPFWAALLVGAAVGAVFGVLMERFIYRPLAARGSANTLLMIFVASLGLSIIGRNVIGLIWLSTTSEQINSFTNAGINVGPLNFTTIDVVNVVVTWTLIIATSVLLSNTKLGRSIRAVRVNPEMSLVVGIDPGRVFLAVFAIGSFLGGVGAVLTATKTSAVPDMGFNPLFYAFVVAFLSGLDTRPVRVGLVGLGLGLVESWSEIWLPTIWTSLVVFAILFVYVALRPVQFRLLFHRFAPRRAVKA